MSAPQKRPSGAATWTPQQRQLLEAQALAAAASASRTMAHESTAHPTPFPPASAAAAPPSSTMGDGGAPPLPPMPTVQVPLPPMPTVQVPLPPMPTVQPVNAVPGKGPTRTPNAMAGGANGARAAPRPLPPTAAGGPQQLQARAQQAGGAPSAAHYQGGMPPGAGPPPPPQVNAGARPVATMRPPASAVGPGSAASPAQQQQQQQQQQLQQRGGTPAGAASARPGLDTPRPSSIDPPTARLLDKRKIQDLVQQVDPREKVDPETEDALLEIADDFIESVTTFACSLAKHRKSDTLEVTDIQLHLDRNWNMRVPGFGGDDGPPPKKAPLPETHRQRLALIKQATAGASASKKG